MTVTVASAASARERILESAYELFNLRRVHDVGVNEVIHHAGVSKATFYSHFPSKDDLVLAYLDLREQRATVEWLELGTRSRAETPEEALLGMFDLLDEWFGEPDFAGCPFINILLEFGPAHPVGFASALQLENVRALLERLADEAGLRDGGELARALHLLMKGAIVSAVQGERDAAQAARVLAARLIADHR